MSKFPLASKGLFTLQLLLQNDTDYLRRASVRHREAAYILCII